MLRGWFAGLRAARRGTTALQIAILLPCLLGFMLAIMDYAWLMWTAVVVQQEATFGARCAATLKPGCTSSGAFSSTATIAYIQGLASPRGVTIPSGNITVAASGVQCGTAPATGGNNMYGFSKVTIVYNYTSIVPNAFRYFGVIPTMTATACAPNEPSGS